MTDRRLGPIAFGAVFLAACGAGVPRLAPGPRDPCVDAGRRAAQVVGALEAGAWRDLRPLVTGPLVLTTYHTDVDDEEPGIVKLATPADAAQWLATSAPSWVDCDGSSDRRCSYNRLMMAEGSVPPTCRAGCYGVPPRSFVTSHRALYVRVVCFTGDSVSSVVLDDGD